MNRLVHVVALVSILAAAGCSKNGESGMGPPDAEASIVFVDPVDGQVITALEDLNTDILDHVQYTVACQTTGLEPGTQVSLHVHHETWGGDWDYTAETDATGAVSFASVTFRVGSATVISEYSLVARTADGEVESGTIMVRIEPSIDGVSLTDVPAEW